MVSFKTGHQVTIADSMIFDEVCFVPPFGATFDEKEQISRNCARLYILENNRLAGEIILCELDGMKDYARNNPWKQKMNLDAYYGKSGIYVASFGVLPEYRRKGYGKMLKAYMFGMLTGHGAHFVMGHANEQSMGVNKYFGAQEIKKFDNWFGSGDQYIQYKITL